MTTLTAARPRTDEELAHAIHEELRWDRHVASSAAIGVAVNHGVVTLTGEVASLAEKTAALSAAHRVAGVRDVANDIVVVFPGSMPVTDADIAQMVRRALAWDTLLSDKTIQSTVAHGWVTLEGTVSRWSSLYDAESAIRNLHGVRGVTNNLTVAPGDPEPDSTSVRTSIEAALERQTMREVSGLTVTVDGGTVTLKGKVRSWQEKLAAAGAAGFAPGVRHVDNLLVVDPYI